MSKLSSPDCYYFYYCCYFFSLTQVFTYIPLVKNFVPRKKSFWQFRNTCYYILIEKNYFKVGFLWMLYAKYALSKNKQKQNDRLTMLSSPFLSVYPQACMWLIKQKTLNKITVWSVHFVTKDFTPTISVYCSQRQMNNHTSNDDQD